MSMRIAICEDCPKDADLLRGQIERYCRENRRPPFDIAVFPTAPAFSEGCAPGAFDLVFMDIYLENEDGMRAVREFRRLDRECLVVFFTRSADHAVEAFEVHAAHYLTKPLAYEKLAQALDRCLLLHQSRGRFILLRTEKALRKVSLNEIVFVEVFDNTSVVHLDHEELHARIPLKELEKEIAGVGGGGNFLRCHRSVLVNMDRITALRDAVFLLDTGLPVPISKYHRGQIIRTYEEFALKRMRETHAPEAMV